LPPTLKQQSESESEFVHNPSLNLNLNLNLDLSLRVPAATAVNQENGAPRAESRNGQANGTACRRLPFHNPNPDLSLRVPAATVENGQANGTATMGKACQNHMEPHHTFFHRAACHRQRPSGKNGDPGILTASNGPGTSDMGYNAASGPPFLSLHIFPSLHPHPL
jgi:hypothetical protein